MTELFVHFRVKGHREQDGSVKEYFTLMLMFFVLFCWVNQANKPRFRTRATVRGDREQTPYQQPTKQPERSQVRDPNSICLCTLLIIPRYEVQNKQPPCSL